MSKRSDDQVGRCQHAVVRVVMLGEPSVVETQLLGQQNLLEQFLEGLFLRYPGPRLIVAERAKPHRVPPDDSSRIRLACPAVYAQRSRKILIRGCAPSSQGRKNRESLAEPLLNRSRLELYVHQPLKQSVKESPCDQCSDDCRKPADAALKFKITENEQWYGQRKADKVNRRNEADDPAKRIDDTSARHLGGHVAREIEID